MFFVVVFFTTSKTVMWNRTFKKINWYCLLTKDRTFLTDYIRELSRLLRKDKDLSSKLINVTLVNDFVFRVWEVRKWTRHAWVLVILSIYQMVRGFCFECVFVFLLKEHSFIKKCSLYSRMTLIMQCSCSCLSSKCASCCFDQFAWKEIFS